MKDAGQLALLLESLRSHDIAFSQKDLQKALDVQNETSTESWIDEHLGPETLLTKDELALYLTLQKSGESEVFAPSQDLSLLRGVWDEDIKSAIEQLQKSTASIENHTETLRTQQETVAALVKDSCQHHTLREATESSQYKSWTTENNHTRSMVDELLQNLKYQIAELTSLCKTADVELRKRASEILRVDDRLLLGLQKVASDLDPAYSEEEDAANRVRDLCARLIKYTVEGVRTRLDRIYLETIAGRPDGSKGKKPTDTTEVASLLEELESLYTEILPVAQMSAEQQYLEPALRLIASHNVHGEDRSCKAIEYISKCLLNLTDPLQEFGARVEEYKHYRAATMLMASAVKSELNADRPLSPKVKKSSSPAHIRKQSKPISPIRPRNTRRRSSTTSFDDDVNPELQILRNLGISLPGQPNNDSNITAALHNVLADRMTKLNGHAKSLQEVLETSIGSHLHDSQVTLQLLMESLLSETRYKSVNLLDTKVQVAMGKLERGVEEIKRNVGSVNLDPVRERNVCRDDLVERWAR